MYKQILFRDIIFINKSQLYIYFISFFQYAYLFLIVIGFLFKKLSFVYAINFLILSFLLNIKVGYNVEDFLAQVSSFWMIFICCEKIRIGNFQLSLSSTEGDVSIWIYLFGINLCLSQFISGINKLYDPIWIHGDAMYYVTSIPWIALESFADYIRQNHDLLKMLTYLSILIELLILPLYVLKRTRFFALVLHSFFYIFLFFPFRLDFIGPLGIHSSLLLWSQFSFRGNRS